LLIAEGGLPHPQEFGNDEMMMQKLDYIHNNPVLGGLVAGPEHWRFSSAHEWLEGRLSFVRRGKMPR
jgi:hypothetical protein